MSRDLDHGFRAGAWVREQLPSELKAVPEHLELIASACDWHVCRDRDARWDHPVLWLLKDAGGLDRVRLGDLNPSYLRHEETHASITPAMRLYRATADLDDPQAIWRKPAELGIPVEDLLAFVAEEGGRLAEPREEGVRAARRPARGW